MKIKRIIIILICIFLISLIALFCLNAYVKNYGRKYILSTENASMLENVDCIVVLGCQVKSEGKPSWMLNDRLIRGVDLYKKGVAPKIIMSGDHGQDEYDEVNTMKKFAIEKGVPSENIFMDHAGFSTYESMYRSKEIFAASKIVIVTQEYHLYRAIYIARKLGIEAYGVHSDYNIYGGEGYRELREILARCKDAVKVIFKIKPTFLGEKIPVSGNGNLTND